MVDVGYFIDGRHGVIRNVSPTSNPYTEHLVFTSADCKEQYSIKYKDVDYIIPHEENTVIAGNKDGWHEYTEEQMIKLCQSVDNRSQTLRSLKRCLGLNQMV